MRAGDVVEVDFGIPVGSEPGFRHPAVVVTADLVLEARPRTVHVVFVTSNTKRALPTEVPIDGARLTKDSVVQCHLCTVVSPLRIVDDRSGNVGPASLASIRAVLADLLDIG